MPVSFKVPSSPKISVYKNEAFLGCDFTSDASVVDDTKSPNCVNMIRSTPGKVRKRVGYRKMASFKGQKVYGVYHFSVTDHWIVHAGNKLYDFSLPMGRNWIDEQGNEIVDYDSDNIVLLTDNCDEILIYTGMAEHRSVAYELNMKLVILDGTSLHFYDGTSVTGVDSSMYIPTLFINKDPEGGSSADVYEPRNLLQPAWKESFYVKRNEVDYIVPVDPVTGEQPSEEGDTLLKLPDGTTMTLPMRNLSNSEEESEGGDTPEPEPSYDPSSVVDFQLAFDHLGSTRVKAWVMDEDGDMVEKYENTDFTVDRTTGLVTFIDPPGASPVLGQDNVVIQAYKTVQGYADRINHCTIGVVFGVNGASDRLFVSGNPDKGYDSGGEKYTNINRDWYSQQYDPTYFPDTGYSQLGSGSSAIMGYAVMGKNLVTFKDDRDPAETIFIRQGTLTNYNPSFPYVNIMQGAGAISKYCFSYMENEPVFLTPLGVYAITPQDVVGNRYTQNRSYYLDGKLLQEEGLEEACACRYKDFYLVAVNGNVYVLDGMQPLRTDQSRPYSTRQYAGFYWENVPATVFFEMNGNLFFGTEDGYICKFYTDTTALQSYMDFKVVDGEETQVPIPAIWETADLCESLFYKNKKYRYLAIKSLPQLASSVEIWAQRHGLWEMIKEDNQTLRYFDFRMIDFRYFSFNVDKTAKVLSAKARLRKLDHVRFRFINEKDNQPFSLNDFAVEYVQNGNHKG